MNDCVIAGKRMVPLMKVVKAAITDTYGDIGKTQELFTHWAARGLKKLNREALRLGKQRVSLPVNGNTRTATLPVDFEEEFFVGYVDEKTGKKIPIKINTSLVNDDSIENVECVDKCPKCNQNSQICNDLTVTETVELIAINDSLYEKTIVKKLYPNGDYYLEITTPILNVDDNTISYLTQKEFITNLDLKPCGCLETTPENIEALRRCNNDVYCCYYASCSLKCNREYGSYIILYDIGLIQMSHNYPFDHVYIEFWSYIPKKNGQYLVPEVAFETLVNWTKFKSVENKSNVPLTERKWVWDMYKIARGNMNIEMGRISIEAILEAVMRTPKLDIDYPLWRECCARPVQSTTAVAAGTCDVPVTTTTTSGNTVVYLYKNIEYKKIQFKVGQSGAAMVAGQTVLNISDPNIFSNSLNVTLDGTTLFEDLGGAIYYNASYSSTGAVVTIYNLDPDNSSINYGVLTDMKLRITYQKTTTTT